MSRALSKKEVQQQQLQQQQQQQQQYARDVETQERHASANASAGLNLNLLGALGGAFSSKQKKTTHSNPDGSSYSVDERHDKGNAYPMLPISSYLRLSTTPYHSRRPQSPQSEKGKCSMIY
ncbi:hypothetical protein DM02DRAFT_612664 [Periconia macrospinosa]|uniref:Uncharacterized protein n=1 Tax=Periconia macrospinosa TaxID=97972 RepID=A0A2V1DY82_9PLEO|nr:hypothetical protein DM02DRAFT_612664 [Periconia macrospinosa]